MPRTEISSTVNPPAPSRSRLDRAEDWSLPRLVRLTNGSRRPSASYEKFSTAGGAGAAVVGVAAVAGSGGVADAQTAEARITRSRRSVARMASAHFRCRGSRRARRTWPRLGGRLDQHVRRGDARRADRRARLRFFLALDSHAADVDDSRKLADAVEEQPQVVISAIELQRDRPLGMGLLRHDRRRLEALDLQIRFRGECLQAAQQIADILFLRQHGAQQ